MIYWSGKGSMKDVKEIKKNVLMKALEWLHKREGEVLKQMSELNDEGDER